jgi:L-2-hydroxyglutarate oxidase
VNSEELPALEKLHEKGISNGLTGIRKVEREEIREIEPYCSGISGLFVPMTGITDYKKVTDSYAYDLTGAGGEVKVNTNVLTVRKTGGKFMAETTGGVFQTKFIINCAGLYSDRVARLCGVEPEILIMPFRGEYYVLRDSKNHLVKNLIYPVPNPELPFLGVHFTRMIKGGVEAGPNAVLAFARKGYTKTSFSISDTFETMRFAGSWKLFSDFWKIGFYEYRRSFFKRYMIGDLRKLLPDLSPDDIEPGGAGIRAQALGKNGKLIDDFYIKEAEGMIHVLNSPSPAATASLSIGEAIASLYKKRIS